MILLWFWLAPLAPSETEGSGPAEVVHREGGRVEGLAAAIDDDAFTVTLAFEKMHCDECKAELEASVKKIQGFKSVIIIENTGTVIFDDKAPIPAFNRLPKDLSLRAAVLTIRGTVSLSGDKATLVAKGSGATLALVNPEKPKAVDRLAELKKQLGGKNRFQVTGALVGGRSIALESFKPADWKEK